jgi:hypothetical protein
MSASSPTLEGFRAALRRPSLTFTEIAWRWIVGATALVALLFYSVEYLDSLPVSDADALLLSTRQPMLIGRAIEHILKGSLQRAVIAALIAALALSVLWIIAASFGRLATVRGLLRYFREKAATSDSISVDPAAPPPSINHESKTNSLRALLDLSFLRAAVVLAAMLAFAGGLILSRVAADAKNSRVDLIVVLFFVFEGAVCVAAWTLNWWLSFAAIFAVRESQSGLGALSASIAVFRERIGSVLAVSAWTGAAHLAAFSIATTASSFCLAFLQIAPAWAVIGSLVLIILFYLAVADWLYIARLAGYVAIVEMPALQVASPVASTPPLRDFGQAADSSLSAPDATLERSTPPNFGAPTADNAN